MCLKSPQHAHTTRNLRIFDYPYRKWAVGMLYSAAETQSNADIRKRWWTDIKFGHSSACKCWWQKRISEPGNFVFLQAWKVLFVALPGLKLLWTKLSSHVFCFYHVYHLLLSVHHHFLSNRQKRILSKLQRVEQQFELGSIERIHEWNACHNNKCQAYSFSQNDIAGNKEKEM